MSANGDGSNMGSDDFDAPDEALLCSKRNLNDPKIISKIDLNLDDDVPSSCSSFSSPGKAPADIGKNETGPPAP